MNSLYDLAKFRQQHVDVVLVKFMINAAWVSFDWQSLLRLTLWSRRSHPVQDHQKLPLLFGLIVSQLKDKESFVGQANKRNIFNSDCGP